MPTLFAADEDAAVVSPAGVILGVGEGETAIEVRAAGLEAATPAAVTDTVFTSETAVVKEPEASPEASVTATGCEMVFPVPLTETTTGRPGTGFPEPSTTVTNTFTASVSFANIVD